MPLLHVDSRRLATELAASLLLAAALLISPSWAASQRTAKAPDTSSRSTALLTALDDTSDAQSRYATLIGRVTNLDDTSGVAGVEIGILGTSISQLTDADGHFRLVKLPAGRYDVLARRFGFAPSRLSMMLKEGRKYSLQFALKRFAIALTEVRINGVLRSVPPFLEDVYRRGATSQGRFITAEDITRLQPLDIWSLLMTVPGMHVVGPGRPEFPRCGYGAEPAKVQVYVDGNRLTQLGGKDAVDLALRTVHVNQIQAMEIYTGVSQIPGEFLNDACAVIAIWTKRGAP